MGLCVVAGQERCQVEGACRRRQDPAWVSPIFQEKRHWGGLVDRFYGTLGASLLCFLFVSVSGLFVAVGHGGMVSCRVPCCNRGVTP